MIPAMSDSPASGLPPAHAGTPPAPPVAPATPGPSGSSGPQPATRLPLWRWMVEGLRGAAFLRPRTGDAAPGPWQLLVLVALPAAALLAAERFTVPGPAQFEPAAWLAPWWISLALLWCAWCALPRGTGPAGGGGRLAAWFALSSWAPLPVLLLSSALQVWAVRYPGAWPGPSALDGAMLALVLLGLVAVLRMSAAFFVTRTRLALFTLATVVLTGAGLWTYPGPSWTEAAPEAPVRAEGDAEPDADTAPELEPEPLRLSQEVFEAQQALWERQVQALVPQRDGVVDVYGLVFAPFAGENVFRRESTMVRELLEERFGARGRVLQLLNHADTAATHVWATPRNLERAVAALGARMDRAHDVLVVYLTSHGGQDHRLAADHWPLEVEPVTPELLRRLLDQAGIRHRVVAVSACYSGGWIEPLATEATLVMTAADATHTSYGCGRLSELTFFGRAVFDEQLRQTHSFTQAFARAVPLIRQREIDAGKDDGFSNPQIRVGPAIAPVLDAMAARLDAAPVR